MTYREPRELRISGTREVLTENSCKHPLARTWAQPIISPLVRLRSVRLSQAGLTAMSMRKEKNIDEKIPTSQALTGSGGPDRWSDRGRLGLGLRYYDLGQWFAGL